MPRHSLSVFVLAIASATACATPSASVQFDQSALVRHHTERGLSHEEQEWLAAGRPEDVVSVDHLGLGEPTAAAIIVDDLGFGPRSAAGDQAANLSQQSLNNCVRQGQDCSDDDDLLDWMNLN